MPRIPLSIGLALSLTLPVSAAPFAESAGDGIAGLSVNPVSLAHPEIELETVVLDDWQLEVGLPAGWAVEDSGELLRFIAPDHLPNCGISFAPEESITKDQFFETIWGQLLSEPGMTPLAAGMAKVGSLGVPLIWNTIELAGVGEPPTGTAPVGDPEAVVPVRFRQIQAYYEFSPEEYPFIATATAPESLWDQAYPEMEAILGHVVALASEEEAFGALEQRP